MNEWSCTQQTYYSTQGKNEKNDERKPRVKLVKVMNVIFMEIRPNFKTILSRLNC